MKICDSCKKLAEDGRDKCAFCGGELKSVIDESTPVVIINAEGFERERIEAALRDNEIPYSVSCTDGMPEKMAAVSASVPADILVPYSYYGKASEVCVGIGALDAESDEARLAALTNSAAEKSSENISAVKRTTTRVITMLIFLVLVAVAVYGTDFIMALIKNLFK